MTGTMRAFGLGDEASSAGFLELPVPEPGPGELRIRVRASSINGYDAYVASGMARGMMEHRYPVVLGKDHAGVDDALGEGVTGWTVGDEVTGIGPPQTHLDARGAYAEYLVVPDAGFLERKPANLTFEQAASLGLAALSGLVTMDVTAPAEGSVVLIVGATGGVGSYAVQLAAATGATVVATGLPRTMPGSAGSVRARSSTTPATWPPRCAIVVPTASTL